MNGKGSKPRPANKRKFDEHFDEIVWNKINNKETKIVKSPIGKAKRYVYK